MQIVIDKDACTFLLKLGARNRHCVEGDATISRTYSALTLPQLQRLYLNTTGYTLEVQDYNAALQACKALALRLLSATTEGRTDAKNEEEAG